jgi:hypothetical protein
LGTAEKLADAEVGVISLVQNILDFIEALAAEHPLHRTGSSAANLELARSHVRDRGGHEPREAGGDGANRDTATWTIDVIRPTPGEVSPPGSASPQLFTGPETMVQEDPVASGSTTFNVCRGAVALLGSGDYGTCFRTGLASNSTTDTDVPAPGVCFTYLVTGKTSGGEGSMGSDSSGNERSNLHSCP